MSLRKRPRGRCTDKGRTSGIARLRRASSGPSDIRGGTGGLALYPEPAGNVAEPRVLVVAINTRSPLRGRHPCAFTVGSPHR